MNEEEVSTHENAQKTVQGNAPNQVLLVLLGHGIPEDPWPSKVDLGDHGQRLHSTALKYRA